jgi:hypothetical protein
MGPVEPGLEVKGDTMKTIPLLTLLMGLTIATATGQAVKTHFHIGRVDGDGPSRPYLARTPYTLRWNVDPKYKLYGNRDPRVKVESYIAAVHVRDVETGRIVHSLGQVPYNGETRVPVAGRHTVEFFSTAPWEASYVEDKTILEAAARRGELKADQTVREASKNSVATRGESVAAVKQATLLEIGKVRSTIGETAANELEMAAQKAAQLASDPADFTRRFTALTADVLENSKTRQAVTKPQIQALLPASEWDGRALPPGMEKAK